MNLIKQAIELHKESMRYFNDFYTSVKWKESENKIFLAIVTSLEAYKLYIRYLLYYKSELLLFKDMYDEMVTDILNKEYQHVDISLHKIDFEDMMSLFDKFYKCEFDCPEAEQYYICLSDWLNILYYKDFINELDYVRLIRDIGRVYSLMEDCHFYVEDIESFKEYKDFNETVDRYRELYSDYVDKNKDFLLMTCNS